MKRFNWVLIGVIISVLAIVLLAGCVSKSEYEALQAEHATLVEENASLKTELQAAQSDLTSVQADYDILKGDHDKLNADYDKLNADYEATNNELTEIKKVYPPRDFSLLRELQDWLLLNDVSERLAATTVENYYSKALEIQEDALKDGYIVSANFQYDEPTDLYYIACIAIINGDIWWWDPETDEPVQYQYLGKVK